MIPRFTLSLGAFVFLVSAAAASAQTPGPPTNLVVTVNANQSLSLQWTAPGTGGAPTRYQVQIGTAAGANNTLNEQTDNMTSYTTTVALSQGVRYFVRVRALNVSGISGPSNEVSVTVPCVAPTGRPIAVTWRMLTATSAQITWVGPSSLSLYKVEVGAATGLSDVAVVNNNGTRTYVTIALPGAGTFFARVRVIFDNPSCSGVDGPPSTEVQIVAGAASPPSTTIVVNEFAEFVELKNISAAAQPIGGWRIQTTTGRSQRGVLAGSVRGGVVIAPGCTYLMKQSQNPEEVQPDEPLIAGVSQGVAVVRPDGYIMDSTGTEHPPGEDFDPDSPFGEDGVLTRFDFSRFRSYARTGNVDTNSNHHDFVALDTPTPQNASGCGQAPPAAPTSLTASATTTTISLSWNAPTTGGIPTGYLVRIGTTSGGSDVLNQRIGTVTTFQTGALAAGTYFARVLALNGAGVSDYSNEVTVVVSGAPTPPGPPGPPVNLTASVSGSTVTLAWSPPASGSAPTQYRLEAGTAPGASNVGLFDLASSPLSVSFAGVPNGTFYARLRAVNALGASGPSNEVTIVVCTTGCTAPPGAVTQLTAQVSARNVLLTWQAPTTGAAPTGYVIEAGTGPGLTNIGQFPTGSTSAFVIVSGVPPGTYFVRVRAAAGGALGPASNEVVVVVP